MWSVELAPAFGRLHSTSSGSLLQPWVARPPRPCQGHWQAWGLGTQLQKLVLRYGSSKLAMLESGNKLPHSKQPHGGADSLNFMGVPATAEFSDRSKTHSFHGRDHPEASNEASSPPHPRSYERKTA